MHECKWRKFNAVVFDIYFILLFLLTVFLRNKHDISEVCIRPFYIFTLAEKGNTVYRSVLLNVLMFVPFGLLLPEILNRSFARFFTIFFIAFGTSVAIEVLQYVFKAGRTEIDDVIFNVLGAIVGYIFNRITIRVMN